MTGTTPTGLFGLQVVLNLELSNIFFFFFQAEDGIRDYKVTGVQTCALPILESPLTAGLQNRACQFPSTRLLGGIALVTSTSCRGWFMSYIASLFFHEPGRGRCGAVDAGCQASCSCDCRLHGGFRVCHPL